MGTRRPHREQGGREAFPCPHCGAQVPEGSHACPACGSDENTGWSQGADVWGADIPTGHGHDDDFDYEEFARQEFGEKDRKAVRPRTILLALLAVAVVAALLGLVAFIARTPP